MIVRWILPLFFGVALLSLAWSFASMPAGASEQTAPSRSWATARRDSAGIAPDPRLFKDLAIVQVYTAPTYGWRGRVAVHPWIIFKKGGETTFTRYDVVSWGSDNVVRRNYALPDGYWFGSRPTLLVDHRGPAAAAMIPKIEAAIKTYPWPHTYRAWPGPNSNTFMAHIGREVPALALDLPSNAIGKDYRSLAHVVGLPPSGRGLQVSFLGLLGITLGIEEGVEINLLGLNLGVDIKSPALRLPFIGRVGMDKVATE